jgi:hypothetical protein
MPRSEVRLCWPSQPTVSLTVLCDRTLTGEQVHSIADVVEGIEVMRATIQQNDAAEVE